MGEFLSNTFNRLSSLGIVAGLGAASLAVAYTTELPPEIAIKNHLITPAFHVFGATSPFEDGEPEGVPMAISHGTADTTTYTLKVTTYVEAEAGLESDLFGEVYSTSEVVAKGLSVSRFEIPGVPTVDLRSTDEALYVTRFATDENGDMQDVGIDLTGADFEIQLPGIAHNENGAYVCDQEPGDPDFAGCMTSMGIDDGWASEAPIIGDEEVAEKLPNSERALFDAYGEIDECDFDAILIPALNSAYVALNNELNLNIPLIDGNDRFQEVVAILQRYSERSRYGQSYEPQDIRVHVTGAYTPPGDVGQRIEAIMSRSPKFPFTVPENLDEDQCAHTIDGQVPMAIGDTQLGNLADEIRHIAILGLPQVPDGYDPESKEFVNDGRFTAPDESMFDALGASL